MCNYTLRAQLYSASSKGNVYGHFIRPVHECMRHLSVRKWKYIMRFEIRYFSNKPHYILSLSTALHAQLYSASSKVNVYGHSKVNVYGHFILYLQGLIGTTALHT